MGYFTAKYIKSFCISVWKKVAVVLLFEKAFNLQAVL